MKIFLHFWKKFQTYRPVVKTARWTSVYLSFRFPSLRMCVWSSHRLLFLHSTILNIVIAWSLKSKLQTLWSSHLNDFLIHLLRTKPSPHTSTARRSNSGSVAGCNTSVDHRAHIPISLIVLRKFFFSIFFKSICNLLSIALFSCHVYFFLEQPISLCLL